MSRFVSRLLTRRASGGDRTAAVQFQTYKVGRLLVAGLGLARFGLVVPVAYDAWGQIWGASSVSPQLLRRIRVVNATGGDGHLWLGIMSVSGGSPGASNAFLAYNTAIPFNTVWEWSGAVPLDSRYLYAKGIGMLLQSIWTWNLSNLSAFFGSSAPNGGLSPHPTPPLRGRKRKSNVHFSATFFSPSQFILN